MHGFSNGVTLLTWLLGARMFGRYSKLRRVGNLGVLIFSSAFVLSSITGNHRMNDELGSFSGRWTRREESEIDKIECRARKRTSGKAMSCESEIPR